MGIWLALTFYVAFSAPIMWYLLTVKEPIRRPPPVPQFVEDSTTWLEWREPPNYVGPV